MADSFLNRSVVTSSNFGDSSDDEYWLSKSPLERIAAIQINRRAAYGDYRASARLQRVLEIAQRTRR